MSSYGIPLGLSLLAIWAYLILRQRPTRKDTHDETFGLGADASAPQAADLRRTARARAIATLGNQQALLALQMRMAEHRDQHRAGIAPNWRLTDGAGDLLSSDRQTPSKRLTNHPQQCEPRKRA